MTLFLLGCQQRESEVSSPALSNIGSMSPARLSLSTVASPHCRLLFYLAAGILAEIEACQGSSEPSVWHRSQGLEVKLQFTASGLGRSIVLDIPLYRPGIRETLIKFSLSTGSKDRVVPA